MGPRGVQRGVGPGPRTDLEQPRVTVLRHLAHAHQQLGRPRLDRPNVLLRTPRLVERPRLAARAAPPCVRGGGVLRLSLHKNFVQS